MSAWQNNGDTEFTARLVIVVGLIALLAIVLGFAGGMFLGRSSSPDLALLAAQARANAKAVSAELAPAKPLYDGAVPTGTIEDATAYADAQARIVSARARLAAADTSLLALAPGIYARAVAALDALAQAASTPVPADTFDGLFDKALEELAILSGA